MKTRYLVGMTAVLLSACSTTQRIDVWPVAKTTQPSTPASSASHTRPPQISGGIDNYKQALAEQIYSNSRNQIYPGNPQALLRSVVVVKMVIDENGKLLRSDIIRSNHDAATEATALNSARNAAPFPIASNQLLRNGKVEVLETWLFNDDGRFQLRTLAAAQLD